VGLKSPYKRKGIKIMGGKEPFYVVLKRKGEIVNGTVHIVRAPYQSYYHHYRTEKQAVCGKGRGGNGWRIVQKRNAKGEPENLCEECRAQNVILELRFDGS
jgi:hypothetical protein